MNTPKQQTQKDKEWKDAKGSAIPFNRTTAYERLCEKNAHTILKEALKTHEALSALKQLFGDKHNEVLDAFKRQEGSDLKETKGNKVWYSFDRGIVVECKIQERVEFDGLLITAAREKLNEFLGNKLSSDDAFVVEMVTTAFETTNGKLDSKRIMHLLSYKSKVRASLFQEACAMIEKSMRRTFSKSYMSVGVRQEDGSYQYVQLNFSSL